MNQVSEDSGVEEAMTMSQKREQGRMLGKEGLTHPSSEGSGMDLEQESVVDPTSFGTRTRVPADWPLEATAIVWGTKELQTVGFKDRTAQTG